MKKTTPQAKKPALDDPGVTIHSEAVAWGQRLCDEYQIVASGGKMLVDVAVAALCRMKEAEALIAKHGAVQFDRFGQPRPHPALVIERDSRSGFLSALRQLHLDVEPLRDMAGRPV